MANELIEALRRGGERIGGFVAPPIDVLAQLGLGMAKQPLAGLYGGGSALAELLRTGDPQAAGMRGGEAVGEANRFLDEYTPGLQTEGGRRLAGNLGSAVETVEDKVGGALGHPIDKLGETSPAMAAGAVALMDTASPGKKIKALKGAKGAIDKAKLGYDPAEIATRYPEKLPGVPTVDPKSGKEYLAKAVSPEAQAVEKVRKAAQKEIDAGNYEPYFPVEERYHIADTSRYPLAERTADVANPKKAETREKFKAQFDTPSVRESLLQAFNAKKDDPLSDRWYAMGQLENEFVKELGPEAGAHAFRRNFSQPMAATTGGADPTANLLMGSYGNYLREHGLPQPQGAWDMPYPIGGRYASGNMEMYDKALNQGKGLSATDQPKRHNFAANFEGHTDRSTIDEQMMKAIDPSLAAPPGASYGTVEGIVNDLARTVGKTPADFQGVTWTGIKDVTGKPMIQVVNEAIERTHRVTGKPKDEIVRDSFVRGTHPLYGLAGAGLGTAAMVNALRGEDEGAQ